MSTSSSATKIRATRVPFPIAVRSQPSRTATRRARTVPRVGVVPRPEAGRGSVLATRQRRGRLLDLHEELDVRLRLRQAVQQQLEGLLTLLRGEDPAQLPDDRQLLLAHQELLAPGARLD